ncbi:hypothetical protein GCM10022383_19450 [Microbacterium soli]|uniref:Uncharacterized protein n=1 Tax=Microbacterium soli TaxID=446075 RepID=A0ABP7NBE9_9MICO
MGSSITTRVGSALAAEQVDEHGAGDEGDREARQSQQTEEEEFEGDGIHVSSLVAPGIGGADAGVLPWRHRAETRADSPNPAETSAMITSAPIALPAARTMNPRARP